VQGSGMLRLENQKYRCEADTSANRLRNQADPPLPNDPWRMAARPPSDLQQISLHPCLEPNQYALRRGIAGRTGGRRDCQIAPNRPVRA
jgi:hypothetical protein